MKAFWQVFDKVLDVMAGLAGIILVFICAAVCYTIGMRFFFTRTTIWVMQTTEYALLWIVFLSTTWLLREKGHIAVDIVYGPLSEKSKRYLDIVMFTLAAAACIVCLCYSSAYTWKAMVNHVTDVRAVTVPKAAVFSIVPVGFFLLSIQFLRMLRDRLVLKEGR